MDDAADLASFYPYTIVTNSLSKSNALTGLRLGWLLGPAPFIEQAIKVHAWVASCADTWAQHVALAVFRSHEGVREHAAWYEGARRNVMAALERTGLPYLVPDGTFYACVQLPDGMRALDAANNLIEQHDVLAIPGEAFGTSLAGWLRLSWVGSSESVSEGVARIGRFCSDGVISMR